MIYIALLAAAVFVCFGRTLGSYFLADDFGEVAYVAKIFEGDLARLWSNFTGNYMQVPSMAVYRPWLLMTLFFDFAVWKTNATGYYLTNLLHYLACTILIFSIVKLLTSYWGKLRSNLASTFSALLFAVNPLHCESVSWVVGRVDIVCLTYYLLGLLSVALYVRSQNKKWLILTFASFWLGILTKEMAIALPVTATVMAFLWGGSSSLLRGSKEKENETFDARPDSHTDLKGERPGFGFSSTAGFVPDSGPGPGSTTEEPRTMPRAEFDPSGASDDYSSEAGESFAPGFSSHISHEPSRATAIAALQKLDQELQQTSAQPTIMERFKIALPVAGLLFACTVVYFIIRYAALGTITGGYTGSIGSSQISGILQKWTDVDTVLRILFPLNQHVFANDTLYRNVLSAIYLSLVALASTRLLIGAPPRRWLVFLFFATVAVLAPIYQLWGIGYNLEGSRFVFFLTVPLSMLFPVILFAPLERAEGRTSHLGTAATAGSPPQSTGLKIVALSAICLTALAFFYSKITLRNNVPWVHAGKQTQALTKKAQALSASTQEGRTVCVLGIPKDEGGAHMILNNTTFRHLITPPFTPTALTGKILTFEPVLFGNPDKIDTGHFKQALKRDNVSAFLVWDMDKKDFVPFTPGAPQVVPQSFEVQLPSAQNAPLSTARASFPYTELRGEVSQNGAVRNADGGLGIRISGLNLYPAQADYVVIDAKMNDKSGFRTNDCAIKIENKDGKTTKFDARFTVGGQTSDKEIRVPLSAYWRYFTAGEITGIVLDLPPVTHLQIKRIRLVPASLISPAVTAVGRASSNDGAFVVDNRTTRPGAAATPASVSRERASGSVEISVDASALQGTESVEVQILKKNYFFDNLLSDAALTAGTQATISATGHVATVNIPEKMLNSSGYVQLRVRALTAGKQQVGEYSYPVTLRVLSD